MPDLSSKVIVTVATTGAWPTREITPYVPIEPEEIAKEVHGCFEEGAAIAHIHVRDDKGRASMDYGKFEQTVGLIRERKDCDIVLNLTTSGGIGLEDDVRMKPFIELKPEMASYDCGSMNWQHSTVFENSPDFLTKLGKKMQENGVKPEIEIFDAGMMYNALHYLKEGVLTEPLHFQFVLGAAGGMAATVQNLVFLHGLLPKNCTWSAFGIGRNHLPILYATLALGGHIRVGMEDNIMYAKGQLARSNREFVARAKRIIKEFGKEPATPAEAREILQLKH